MLYPVHDAKNVMALVFSLVKDTKIIFNYLQTQKLTPKTVHKWIIENINKNVHNRNVKCQSQQDSTSTKLLSTVADVAETGLFLYQQDDDDVSDN